MKILLPIIAFLCCCCCKAQSPVVPLSGDVEYGIVAGAYYKDTFGDFDAFTGTWKYISASDTLTVVLKKKLQWYNSTSNFYTDMVVGGYR